MARRIKSVSRILICSALLIVTAGCSLTLGPQVEKKAIIVQSGVPIEVVQQVKVDCRIYTSKDGEADIFRQDIGGWITMHPNHWKSLKAEMKRLQKKVGED